jgi:hypothetical protein
MNQRAILAFTLFFLSYQAIGQHIKFDYDDNGNRISRVLFVEEVQSSSVKFPIMNPRSLQKFNDNQQPESLKTKDEPLTAEVKSENEVVKPVVYPNPTKGLLRVMVPTMPLNALTDLRVYDLNGTELIIVKNPGTETEIDISQYRDGIYILRMKIDQLIFTWKIVKNH